MINIHAVIASTMRNPNNAYPHGIHEDQVLLNCSPSILNAFKSLLRNTPILGCSFMNPYTGEIETIPQNADQLTALDLQRLARNERANLTGKMAVNLYNGTLTSNQIASLRCLVKATTVSGVTYARAYGGFSSNCIQLPVPQKTIVIDQAGFQWQGDLRNTGGLFFYPNANQNNAQLPPDYANWQNEMYQAMYSQARPLAPSSNQIDVTWLGVRGILDLNAVEKAMSIEFLQALDAAVASGNNSLEPHERINFRFLKAGMGYFSSGLQSNRQVLCRSRLLGIEKALLYLENMPLEIRQAALGKVKRLELPFSDDAPDVLSHIEQVCERLGLIWGGAPFVDALEPCEAYIVATTNCGDPHAMPGNEGDYTSVDASISGNAYINHLNAGSNAQMQLRAAPEFLEFGQTTGLIANEPVCEPQPIFSMNRTR